MYDEERRLFGGSDSCRSGADSGFDSEAELGEGELVRLRQGPLQPDSRTPTVLGKRVQREEVPLQPKGLAPKRLRELHTGQEGQGKQQQRKGGEGRGGAEQRSQGQDKWSMPGFSVSPGSAVQVAGSYSVQAVQTQVTLQGTAGRETWLGVDLLRAGG